MLSTIVDNLAALPTFIERGGDVLWLIGLLVLVMWTLIMERVWYYKKLVNHDIQSATTIWQQQTDHHSWKSRQIQSYLISKVNLRIHEYLPMIKTLVALCPLLGLLGTVTGMIEVFNVMAVTGGGDAKAMAGGVSRATIPTMAGMVAALSGVFANTYINNLAKQREEQLRNHLT